MHFWYYWKGLNVNKGDLKNFRPKMQEILNLEQFLSLNIQSNYPKMILEEKQSWATSWHLRQLPFNFLQVVYNYKETQKLNKGVQYEVHTRANNTCYTSCYYIGQFIKNTKFWEFNNCGRESFYSLTPMQKNPTLISRHDNEYKYWHDMGIPEPKIHKSY